MQAGCRDCGDRVKAPHNGVKDHHLMDMTLYAGLVTVVMLSFVPSLIAIVRPVRHRGHRGRDPCPVDQTQAKRRIGSIDAPAADPVTSLRQ